MLQINRALQGSVPALKNVNLRFSTLELLFHCYYNEILLNNESKTPNFKVQALYEQKIRDAAAHYYGFSALDITDLICAIQAFEYGDSE